MFKLFALLALVAVVYSTNEETKSFLLSQGLSAEAVNGIMTIADNHRVEDKPGNEEAGAKAMKEAQEETNNFIKTLSAQDQAAYKAMIDKEAAH